MEVKEAGASCGGLRCKGYFKVNDNETPLISILTIVYNDCRNIEKTIRSVISQSYRNVEYIVVDGGSTDDTVDVIRQYENGIDYWLSEKDKGISDAFNKGISLCTGQYVGLLNAGDWYEPDAITLLVETAKKENNPDVVYGKLRFWSENGRERIQTPDHRKLNRFMSICHPSVFVNMELYQRTGLFDEQYRIAMDYDFFYRAVNQGACFCYIPDVIANMSDGGISSTNIIKSIQEVAKVKMNHSGSVVIPLFYYMYQIARHMAGNLLRKLINR